jgi:hypothetical protein
METNQETLKAIQEKIHLTNEDRKAWWRYSTKKWKPIRKT